MALIQRIFNSRDRRRSWGFRCKNDKNFESPESLASHKTWCPPEFESSQIHLLVFREKDGKKLLFDSRAIKKKEEVETHSENIFKEDKGASYRRTCIFIDLYPISEDCGYTMTGQSRNKQACRSTLSGPFARLRPSSLSSQGSQESLPGAVPNGSPGPAGSNSNYTFLRPSSDVKLLGEMMFGSVAMVYRGPLLKVHTIKVPPQLLLSQVFALKPPKDSSQDQDSLDLSKDNLNPSDLGMRRSISMTSIGDMDKEPVAHSMPVAVPQSPCRNRDDSSPAASASNNSFITPFPSPLNTNSGTPSSFHKRWLRNQMTSMENGVVRRRSSDVMEEQMTYWRKSKSLYSDKPIARRVRNPKISIGIVITLFEEGDNEKMQKFQSFFFSHFNLIEGLFYKLTCAIEKALTYQKRNYVQPVMQALEKFRSSVHALYTAPRIQKPIWLNMMTFPLQRNHLCEHLMRELMMVFDTFNNKQSNFFLSRLLTGVLTHHLAWVPTVMPAGATPSRAYLDKHSSTTLDWLAKSHPYNPLWAQLGDMYGAVGYPNKIAKTIIVGKKADLVCRLLYVLTYFIRCSEVHEIQEKREEVVMEYKEVATNCGYDFISVQALESGYHSSQDSEEQMSSGTSEPTNHLESSLETVEETSESCSGSPDETFNVERKSTLTGDDHRTDLCSPEDGDRTPVALSPESAINCNDKNSTCLVKTMVEISEHAGMKTSGSELALPINQSSDSSVPLIKCKEDFTVATKHEVEIPVGCAAPLQNIEYDQPLIKCKDSVETISQPKFESVGLVGRANVGRQETVVKSHDKCRLQTECPSEINGAGDTIARTDRNENKLIDQTQTDIVDRKFDYLKEKLDNVCVDKPRNACEALSLKLAAKQCNSTMPQEDSGRKSPEVKETHDLYNQGNTNAGLSAQDQKNRVHLCRSLSADSTTSSACSGESESSGLWIDVNKGSEVLADNRTNTRPSYIRGLSTSSVFSTTSSTLSFETDGTLTPDHEELPLAFSELIQSEFEGKINSKNNYTDNFGRSLLGGLSQKYIPEMALHGVAELDVQDVMTELELSAKHSVLDEAITEAVCIVANTDKWTVELLSSERPAPTPEKPLAQEIACSESVSNLLDSVQHLWNMKMPSDYCLMHLEDCLQQLYFKSTLMAAYLDKNPTSCHKDLSMSLGVETSDIPLLLGVTSVHAPQVIMNVLRETFENQTFQAQ